MTRQQRRYDDDSGYRHIHVELEDTKEPMNRDNRKFASFDQQEPRESVLEISSTKEYIVHKNENQNVMETHNIRDHEYSEGERYV